MTLKVNDRSSAVEKMAEEWPIVETLLGGTRAMRKAGQKYLPKWPAEEKDSYEDRLKVATLMPAFERTLNVMAGKPFSKELTFGESVPEEIIQWCESVDDDGTSLHAFSSELMAEVLAYGIAGVLVDYTRHEQPLIYLADAVKAGARPYMVMYKHNQILGWKTSKVNGKTRLSQLRLLETAEIDDGEFGSKTVNRVRVLYPGAWQLWEEAKDDYVLIDEGETTLSEIPFVPFYGKQTGFMTGVSPLLNLAYQNVQHWQDSSDQQKSTRFARVRMAAIIGDDSDDEICTGADYFMKLPLGSDIKVVQGSAESVNVGRQELDRLEDQMIKTGAELLTPQPGNRTATEASNDAEANKSELQKIVESFEDSLDQCLQWMAEWVGLPDGGKVALFKDFASATLTDASAQLVLTMQQAGLISKTTAIKEQQRRGLLSPEVDAEVEVAAVEVEAPAGFRNDNTRAD